MHPLTVENLEIESTTEHYRYIETLIIQSQIKTTIRRRNTITNDPLITIIRICQ